MKSINYKCGDCQHEFTGNDFTTECAQCNSSNIKRNKGGGINKNVLRIILIAVAVIIVLIIIARACNGPDESPNQIPNDSSMSTDFEVYEKNKSLFFRAWGNSSTGVRTQIAPQGVSAIRNELTNSDIAFSKEGQLFVCPSDTGNVVPLKITFKEKTLLDSRKSFSISLFGKMADPNAKCPVICAWDDFRISGPKNCEYSLQITEKGKQKGISPANIKLSISGLEGPYQKELKWKAEDSPNNKFEIYIVYNDDKDTLKGYYQNGGAYPDCAECTAERASEITRRLYELGNAYGANPNKRNQRPFRSLIFSFSKQIIKLDGNSIDVADLENTIKTEYENIGQKFRVKGTPTLNEDCTVVSIHFERI